MRFCFLTPVWGRAYIDEYAEFSIPTLLAPNNIPALAATADVTYRVMTTTADARHLRQTAAFKRLSELVTVDIVRIDDLDKSNPTHAMSQAYIRGLRKSIRRNDIAFFIVTPDQIFADGAITGLARPVLDEGKRAVMSDGIRLASEGTKPILDREFRSKAGDTIAVPPRELAGIMTEYLHPISESRLYDSDRHNEYPGILYWRVDDEGILVRSFHPHPFVIYPRIKRAEFRSTIDHDYVLEVCPHGDEVAVVEDSDQALVCELSTVSYVDGNYGYNRATPKKVASWAAYWANPHHRRFARATMRFHSGELGARWHEVQAESDSVIEEALSILDQPKWKQLLNHPVVLSEQRRRRRDRPMRLPEDMDRPMNVLTPRERLQRMRGRIYPRVRDTMVGRIPDVHMLHPYYFAYRDRRRTLARLFEGFSGRVLIVGAREHVPMPRRRNGRKTDIDIVAIDEHLNAGSDVVALLDARLPFPEQTFDAIVWMEVPLVQPIKDRLVRLGPVMKDSGFLYLDMSAQYHDLLPSPARPIEMVHEHLLPLLPRDFKVRQSESFGSISSTLAIVLALWGNQVMNATRLTRALKIGLLPVWLTGALAINLALSIFDRMLPLGPVPRKGFVVCEKVPAPAWRKAEERPEARTARPRRRDAPAEPEEVH